MLPTGLSPHDRERAGSASGRLRPAPPRPAAARRGALAALATGIRPVVLAGERRLAVAGELGSLLPGGGLQRGSVVGVEGRCGSGASTLVLRLAAAAAAVGEWVAVVDPEGVFGAEAALEAGVDPDRLAVVRLVPAAVFPAVLSVLVEGVGLVAARVPRGLRAVDARRLAARVREQGSVLVAVGAWPAEVSVRLRAEGSEWGGLGWGEGLLADRSLRVTVSGSGAASRERRSAIDWAGAAHPAPAAVAAG